MLKMKLPAMALAALANFVAIGIAVAAQPQAPPRLCIDGSNCVNSVSTPVTSTPPATVTTGAMKWHPGHYGLSDTRPIVPGYQSGVQNLEMAAMAAAMQGGAPKMRGFQVDYSWYWLETAPGVYNTSMIDSDLAFLAALSKKYGTTFRLIIAVREGATGSGGTLATPQPVPYSTASMTYRGGILPDYIINGVSGLGKDAVLDGYGTGVHPALWRAPVMDRFIALIKYLGTKYDSNPNVEMFVPIGETAWNLTPAPGDLNGSNWTTQMKRLVDAVSSAWPTTVKILTNNFSGTNYSPADVVAVSQYAVSKGVGFGGPDILYGSYGESVGALILRGAGTTYVDARHPEWGTANFGTVDYRGQIPIAYQEQANAYVWTGETSEGVESYAYNTLKATHVVWANHGTAGTAAQQWLTGVVPALTAVSYRINGACPAIYKGNCKTD